MTTKRSRELKYAAHTAACTFYLDGDGVCRRIMLTKKGRTGGGSSKAERCLGAQYVASLDPERPAQLIALPTPGAPMMFAHVDKSGRVSLVRTGPVERFEDMEEGAGDAPLSADIPAPASEPSIAAPRRDAATSRREPRPAKRDSEERKRSPRGAASLELDLAALAATRDDNEPYVDGADRTLKHSRASLEAALKTARRLPDLDDRDEDDEEHTMLRSPPPASDATPRVGVLPRRRR